MNKGSKELKEKYQRLAADFVNYQQSTERRLAEARQKGTEGVLTELLPILDNLQRAIEHLPQDLREHNWAKGILAIEGQLINQLKQMGIEKIEVCSGQLFNPQWHEAISSRQDDSQPNDVIMEVVAFGWRLGERVIRPARVIVNKISNF